MCMTLLSECKLAAHLCDEQLELGPRDQRGRLALLQEDGEDSIEELVGAEPEVEVASLG